MFKAIRCYKGFYKGFPEGYYKGCYKGSTRASIGFFGVFKVYGLGVQVSGCLRVPLRDLKRIMRVRTTMV